MPLKVSDGMGAWIDDFKKSDAPQFKGKSDKERRDQAIAAYMSAKNEQVDESSDAYGKSLEKEKEKRLTSNDQDKLARLRRMMDREKTKVAREPKGEYDRKVGSYLKKKYNKEDVEQVDELSQNTLRQYHGKSALDIRKKKDQLNKGTLSTADHKKAQRRVTGINRAANKMEDVELGEETTFEVEVEGLPTMYVKAKSPGEVKANLRKIVKQPSMITGVSRVTDAEMKKVFRDKAQGREKDDDDLDEAVKKDEREYGYEGDMAISQLKTIMRHAEHMMGMLKEDTDLPEWVQSKITLATDYMQTAHDYMMSEMTEGTQQVDELSQNTLRQYHGKSALYIRKKRDQLNKGTLSTADHKKAQRRVTGINRAANKMEEVDQLDEVTQGKSYTQAQLHKKIQSGNWEATHDIKPGKHVEMRHHTGKRVMVHVKEDVEEGMKPDRKAPGWMLRADPKLKAKVDANKAKNKEFKKLVGTKKEQASMCEQCGKVHEGNCSS